MGNPAEAENSSYEREQPGHVDDQSGMPETGYPSDETSHPRAENYPPSAPSDGGGSVYSGTRGIPLQDQQNAQAYPPQQTYQLPQNPQMNNHEYQQHPQQQPYPSPAHNYQGNNPLLTHQSGYVPTQPAYTQPTPPPTSPYQQQRIYPNPAPVPSHYANKIGTQAWTTGLFDCMEDPNNALITFLAPCFTFGQIAEIIDEGHSTCTTSGIMYAAIAFLTALPSLISCGYRSKLRNKYDLVEAPAADWMTHVFCEWCALCQEYRELKNRGYDPEIGWHGNQLKLQAMQQQQQQVQMAPPMNQNMNG